jgi:hypothetical protein
VRLPRSILEAKPPLDALKQWENDGLLPADLGASKRVSLINGVQRTWFCGAWWGKGFHEDGVVSALRVAEELVRRT